MTTFSPSNSSIPGAFSFDSTLHTHERPPLPCVLSGAKSHIFQPPRTPSTTSASSSLHLARSSTALDHSISSTTPLAGSRKRMRSTDPHRDASMETPILLEEPLWDGEEAGSPLPFVNTRYKLAGGMDTPGLQALNAEEHEASYFDVGYRKHLSGIEGSSVVASKDLFTNGLMLRESNRRPRVQMSYAQDSPGWGRPILQAVGGVVGKVWEFCKMGAFQGFHAGGGKGYDIDSGYQTATSSQEENSFWEDEKRNGDFGIVSIRETTLPGRFPEEDYIADYMDFASSNSHNASPRPAKRRQVSNHKDDITKNWIVVPPASQPIPISSLTSQQPPSRAPARYSMPTTSSANRRNHPSFYTPRPASRAGHGRRPIMMARGSHAGSPSLRSNQGASYASPRSPGGSRIPVRSPSPTKSGRPSTPSLIQDSPAGREAQRWAAIKKKEEREADESIRRLDQQLKAMIREGKEALGSKVEVEFEGEPGARSCARSLPKRGSIRKWPV